MNEDAKNLSKPVGLSSISTYTLETVEIVDELRSDGRANLLDELPPGPGGLAFYALRGVRMFDLDAELAIGGLIGGLDQHSATDAAGRAGLATRYLIPVPRKITNRSRVVLDRHDHKQIVRLKHDITFEHDLTPERRRWLLGLVAQSRASLLGNLPPELTAHAIEFGRHTGSYVGLAAGDRQLARLGNFRPHALFLNFGEARRATGLQTDDAEQVFESLLDTTKSDHLVVMSGGGKRPTYVAERRSGRQWKLDPIDVAAIPERNGFLNTLGCGDMLAGTTTFLLGMPCTLLAGEAVLKAVRFGQEVATAHLSGSPWAAKQLRASYAEIRALLHQKPDEEDKTGQAA